MYLCIYMCDSVAYVCGCFWKPDKGVRSLGAGVTSSCEPPDVVAGNLIVVLCKSSK